MSQVNDTLALLRKRQGDYQNAVMLLAVKPFDIAVAERMAEATRAHLDALFEAAPALLEEIDRLQARVTELLAANNREVERRRAAEAKTRDLATALSECADRLEQCCIVSQSDPEYAALAVARYRAMVSEVSNG